VAGYVEGSGESGEADEGYLGVGSGEAVVKSMQRCVSGLTENADMGFERDLMPF
jgi:hypothetical protein